MCYDNNAQVKAVDILSLRKISFEVLDALKGAEVRNDFQYSDYHGFEKTRLPDEILKAVLWSRSLNQDDVQIEVVRVHSDLTDQIHHHEYATAYVTILGENHGYPDPQHAYAYFNNKWRPVSEGETIKISNGIAHGFTVTKKGELFFLSVQSPAIVRQYGKDDYILHDPVPLNLPVI